MEGDSKQVRKVIREVFKKEQLVPGNTWSDASKAMDHVDRLNVAWDVGHKCSVILPKVNAALRAAGYSNIATMTQDTYLRVQAPRG